MFMDMEVEHVNLDHSLRSTEARRWIYGAYDRR